jgi:hypothetical protein
MRRKHSTEAHIDHEEIARLRELIEREERLEQDLKEEVREVARNRDRKLFRELNRQETKNRRLIMWIGVTIFMLIIFALWASRLTLMVAKPIDIGATKDFDLTEAQANLQKTVQEVVKGIDEIKKQAKQLDEETAKATTSAPIKVNNNATLP